MSLFSGEEISLDLLIHVSENGGCVYDHRYTLTFSFPLDTSVLDVVDRIKEELQFECGVFDFIISKQMNLDQMDDQKEWCDPGGEIDKNLPQCEIDRIMAHRRKMLQKILDYVPNDIPGAKQSLPIDRTGYLSDYDLKDGDKLDFFFKCDVPETKRREGIDLFRSSPFDDVGVSWNDLPSFEKRYSDTFEDDNPFMNKGSEGDQNPWEFDEPEPLDFEYEAAHDDTKNVFEMMFPPIPQHDPNEETIDIFDREKPQPMTKRVTFGQPKSQRPTCSSSLMDD
jgi:hypothetical protein